VTLAEEFQALKGATKLDTMTLEALEQLCIQLSNMRLEAGGTLRHEIYSYALEANEHLTARHLDREEDIRAAQAADPVRAAKAQRIGARAFDGKLEDLLVQKMGG
jgi:hypothetical protein